MFCLSHKALFSEHSLCGDKVGLKRYNCYKTMTVTTLLPTAAGCVRGGGEGEGEGEGGDAGLKKLVVA